MLVMSRLIAIAGFEEDTKSRNDDAGTGFVSTCEFNCGFCLNFWLLQKENIICRSLHSSND